MNFQLRLLSSNREISQLILENISTYLNPRLDRALVNIQNNLSILVADALRSEPEYQSLLSGQLKAELGIPDTDMIESVVVALSQAININKKPISIKTNGISGGFTINMIKSNDLSGVIKNAAASINVTEGSIPWLEWLTLKGNEILVKDYIVKLGPNPNSRSGMAIMKGSVGDAWRVPPMFAGTENNNWITRAISRIENNIYDLIIKSIEDQI